LILGTREFIERARRTRKMFGGGMRQVGILAAAGIYAIEHNLERLADDHFNARYLAEKLSVLPGLTVDLETVQTNIVIATVDPAVISVDDFTTRLATRGCYAYPSARRGCALCPTWIPATRIVVGRRPSSAR